MAKRTLVIGEKAHKSGKKAIRVTKEAWLAEVAKEGGGDPCEPLPIFPVSLDTAGISC